MMNAAPAGSAPAGSAPADSARIAIAGATPLARAGLRALVEREPDFSVVGDGASLSDVLHDGGAGPPDIALVDLDEPGETQAALLERVRSASGTVRMLALTAHDGREIAGALVVAGVRGIVSKHRPPAHLMDAIRKVRAGELWVDRAMAAKLIADLAGRRVAEVVDPDRARITLLTPRERDVMALVAGGLSNKAVGRKLGISDNTVRHHLTSVFEKLGVADRLSLVLYAVTHGLGTPRAR